MICIYINLFFLIYGLLVVLRYILKFGFILVIFYFFFFNVYSLIIVSRNIIENSCVFVLLVCGLGNWGYNYFYVYDFK